MVRDHPHRHVSLEEFGGFALTAPYAPLIVAYQCL